MNWLLFGLFAHGLFGLSGAFDKIILKKALPQPLSNAFYLGLLGALALLLVPFGFFIPAPTIILLGIASGVALVYGFLAYFWVLKKYEATVILPIILGAVPIVTLALSALILHQGLASIHVPAFIALILGIIFLSTGDNQKKKRLTLIPVGLALVVATLFSLGNILGKFVYNDVGFINGFIWIKIGGLLAAALLLANPKWRKIILTRPTYHGGIFFVSNRVLAGTASVIFNYSIFLGSVTLLNALQGVQLVTIFLVVLVITRMRPDILREAFDQKTLLRKIAGTAFIILGVFLLGA